MATPYPSFANLCAISHPVFRTAPVINTVFFSFIFLHLSAGQYRQILSTVPGAGLSAGERTCYETDFHCRTGTAALRAASHFPPLTWSRGTRTFSNLPNGGFPAPCSTIVSGRCVFSWNGGETEMAKAPLDIFPTVPSIYIGPCRKISGTFGWISTCRSRKAVKN